MAKNAPISEMQKFHFGNKIFCTDGQGGRLIQVLVDAATRRLTHLVVKQSPLFGKTFSLPFTAVITATGEGIWLNITLDQLVAPVDGAQSGIVLDQHTVVRGDAASGTLELVAVQPASGELAYVVVHNVPGGHATLLREHLIADLVPGQIVLTADAPSLRSLPLYRSDKELQKEIDELVFDLGFLHIDLKGLRLRVLDGVLYMDGNVSSVLRSELVRDQVIGVAGLLEIKNNLVGDDMLAADIARALGQDEQTRELPIGVYPQLGIVRLSGSVRTAQQKAIAGEIAQKSDGVRGVINNLIVDPSADMLYVMSAPEGGEARDIAPGKFTRHTK